ncbi:WD repeat-containing protein 93-like isoform X1 [Saccostrea echinata]|uniref:WD repeat-containing protein 93-like isoform X1 n=1 Tax=Saccostrea echinata TaxID=191078 RepID=UPI002A816002|nr:WD repeat-containing protein 93-like isoform X1 [Saccostrea echinata]
MPVYIRKNVNFTPPSIDKFPLEDDEDYITDPDQLVDRLPQPYRMIDKVLTQWYDEVWEIIEKRENERLEESRRIRPPQYDCSNQMKSHGRACCICDSVDGRYIFIGLPRGLAAVDSLTQERIATWEEESVDIHYVKAYLIGVQVYLVTTIDDMGFARLFIFGGDKFYFVKILNEFQRGRGGAHRPIFSNPAHAEGGTKLIITKCEASRNGDYLGAVFENPETAEVWLEVYKLPRDAWLSELESVLAQAKKEEKTEDPQEQGTEPVATTDEEAPTQTEVDPSPPVTQPRNRSISRTSSRQSVNMAASSQEESHGEKQMPKLSPTSVVMKLKPPPSISELRQKGNTSSSVYSACQKVDAGEVIGTGINHILTPSHKEMRKEVFAHLHDNLIDYLPKEEELESLEDVNFHFMTAGRLVPFGLEQQSQIGNEDELKRLPTTIAVWWKGSTHMVHYSLLKQHKDFEVKPDLVWPFTSPVTSSSISDDSSLLAVGFENGNVVIWDRYLGIQRGVVNIVDQVKIAQLIFLDPSICPQTVDDYKPYRTKSSTYLLILCDNGALFVMMTGPGLELDPICVTPRVEKEDDIFTLVQPVQGMHDLLITILKSGKVQIRDTLQGKVLCEPVLPKSHELMTPWDPVVAVGAMGQLLFLKGNNKDYGEEEGGDQSESAGALFVYQMRSFPSLDSYMTKKRDKVQQTVHAKIENRIEELMKERIAMQGLRKSRMQERWGNLKEEIWSILQYKDEAEKLADVRPEVHYKYVRNFSQTPGSMGWSPFFQK